jgi:predicted DCC family thiol-disulfide oxidoreductase YuxK
LCAPLDITVIYDGQCRFCIAALNWARLKLSLTALPFQSTDLTPFSLTKDQCAKEVVLIADGLTYHGAAAIAYLLKRRGNSAFSLAITASGKLGHLGYRWVATHRNSALIKTVTHLLERAAK